jgi:RNA polymerase sigma factor (sigma-70 family)
MPTRGALVLAPADVSSMERVISLKNPHARKVCGGSTGRPWSRAPRADEEFAILVAQGVQSPHSAGDVPAAVPSKQLVWHPGERLVSLSTTYWLRQLKAGNKDAAQELWERYYQRLVAVARKRLNGRLGRSVADESDIAQSAFMCFYRAAQAGRFPQLNDRNDLWRLLITIAERRIIMRLRRENRLKRTPSKLGPIYDREPIDVDEIAGREPTPEFCAVTIESVRSLLNQLDDSTLRSLALMKLEGYTNEEMARRLGCSLSTVERKLRRIRHTWTSAVVTAEDRGDA